MDQISCEDTDFKLAVCKEKQCDETKRDFEKTALHIIPMCPVARKHNTENDNACKAEITAIGGDETPKKGHGKTGVALCYHTHDECE